MEIEDEDLEFVPEMGLLKTLDAGGLVLHCSCRWSPYFGDIEVVMEKFKKWCFLWVSTSE